MKEMRIRACCLLLLLACVLTGCKKDDDERERSLLTGDSAVELYSVVNQSKTITITAESSWTATCQADWVTFSPRKGEAGTTTITLTTTSTNRTKAKRQTQLVLKTGTQRKTVDVTQRDEFAVFDQEEYDMPAEGGRISPAFTSNLTERQLALYVSEGFDDWIAPVDPSQARTKAVYSYYMNEMLVQPNTERNARDAAVFLMMDGDDGELLPLDTLWIYQQGQGSDYESQDFSADGEVKVLAQSTEGQGIPVVLIGDGFQDRAVADGTYQQVMEQTMEQLFSEEPVKSMREYFDVYAITAVSKHDLFGGNYSTALDTEPDHQSMGIEIDTEKVMDYLDGVRKDVSREDMLVVVVMNSSIERGCTYYYSDRVTGKPINFSIAICTMSGGLDTEGFRSVLVHEAIGHGLTKLADEYVNSESGSATDEDVSELKELHGYDWYLNVDAEESEEKVLWSTFISDDRYQREHIGVYESGWTFFKGIYRPSEESMMNQNDSPFNAPSRRAIYNKVRKLAEGSVPTYEEFVAFDEQHKPASWSYKTKTRSPWADYLRSRKNSCISWRQLSSSTPPSH